MGTPLAPGSNGMIELGEKLEKIYGAQNFGKLRQSYAQRDTGWGRAVSDEDFWRGESVWTFSGKRSRPNAIPPKVASTALQPAKKSHPAVMIELLIIDLRF